MKTTIVNRKAEQGFTLVELAIVMIIIGLLIGGILKGQELIANARIASTVAQVKAIDTATTTFRDKYDAFPGDMGTASTRLPATGCGGAACVDGATPNNRLDDAPLVAPASEGVTFFQHLAAADLLGGIAFNGTTAWGDIYPAAEVDGGFHAGYYDGVAGTLGDLGAAPPAGHYLSLVSTPGAAAAGDTLTPNQAQRIDTKLDDGAATSGSVVGNGAAGGCALAAPATGYDEANQATICDLAIRFQS